VRDFGFRQDHGFGFSLRCKSDANGDTKNFRHAAQHAQGVPFIRRGFEPADLLLGGVEFLTSRRMTAKTLSGCRFSGFFKAAAIFLAVAFGGSLYERSTASGITFSCVAGVTANQASASVLVARRFPKRA
jgi:hypothetical protein